MKHGGGAAITALQKGEPLTGPGRQAELAVYEDLETQGRAFLVRRNAARLQAAADLYWGAIVRLMEGIGDDEPADVVILKLDTFVKRFGWLAGASLRAWAAVKEEEKASGSMLADYEEIVSEAERLVS
jgi:hypothetical protein